MHGDGSGVLQTESNAKALALGWWGGVGILRVGEARRDRPMIGWACRGRTLTGCWGRAGVFPRQQIQGSTPIPQRGRVC